MLLKAPIQRDDPEAHRNGLCSNGQSSPSDSKACLEAHKKAGRKYGTQDTGQKEKALGTRGHKQRGKQDI
eukprot:1069397-Pelagomonas_calceolata.AAC.4